jgi:hypothetical protein
MIQTGGFDLLIAWSTFVLLLLVLAVFVLRVRSDVFAETARSTTTDGDSPTKGGGDEPSLDDANLRRLEAPET